MSMQTSMNYVGKEVFMSALFRHCCLSLIFQTCLLHLGIVAWGEGLSNRELPTCVPPEVCDLLIILQSVCAGHLYFVYVISILCIIIL